MSHTLYYQNGDEVITLTLPWDWESDRIPPAYLTFYEDGRERFYHYVESPPESEENYS
jgi:hypothetical protein